MTVILIIAANLFLFLVAACLCCLWQRTIIRDHEDTIRQLKDTITRNASYSERVDWESLFNQIR